MAQPRLRSTGGGAYVPLTRREMSLGDDAALSRVVNAMHNAQHVRKHVSSRKPTQELSAAVFFSLPARLYIHRYRGKIQTAAGSTYFSMQTAYSTALNQILAFESDHCPRDALPFAQKITPRRVCTCLCVSRAWNITKHFRSNYFSLRIVCAGSGPYGFWL